MYCLKKLNSLFFKTDQLYLNCCWSTQSNGLKTIWKQNVCRGEKDNSVCKCCCRPKRGIVNTEGSWARKESNNCRKCGQQAYNNRWRCSCRDRIRSMRGRCQACCRCTPFRWSKSGSSRSRGHCWCCCCGSCWDDSIGLPACVSPRYSNSKRPNSGSTTRTCKI